MTTLTLRNAAVLNAAMAALLCGCAKENAKPDSSAVAQAGAATTAAPSSKASFDPSTRVAVIHARDFAFDAPDTIPAGWTTLHLVNDGTTLHHVQLVRLDSGKTASDVEAVLKTQGPPPRWVVESGGPNAPAPGGQSDAVVNLAAGNYVLICFIDIPDHVMHAMKGMVRPLTVTAASSNAGLEPTADATIDLSDYTFTVAALTAGKHTFKIANTKGTQHHEMELVRLAPGKTVKDLAAWVDKPNGPPPADALGGITGVMPGSAPQYFTVDLIPGNYAMLCFLPDAKDGKAHIEHGMVKEFTIK